MTGTRNKFVRGGHESMALGAIVGTLLGAALAFRILVTVSATHYGILAIAMVVMSGAVFGLFIGIVFGDAIDSASNKGEG